MFIDIYDTFSCKYMKFINKYIKTVSKYLNWLEFQIPAFRAFCKTGRQYHNLVNSLLPRSMCRCLDTSEKGRPCWIPLSFMMYMFSEFSSIFVQCSGHPHKICWHYRAGWTPYRSIKLFNIWRRLAFKISLPKRLVLPWINFKGAR